MQRDPRFEKEGQGNDKQDIVPSGLEITTFLNEENRNLLFYKSFIVFQSSRYKILCM